MNQTESQYRLLQTELHFLHYTNYLFFSIADALDFYPLQGVHCNIF